MFLASAVLMTGLTLIFSYVWYRDYVFIDMLLSPFHKGRNYTVIALYVVMLFTFFTVYGQNMLYRVPTHDGTSVDLFTYTPKK